MTVYFLIIFKFWGVKFARKIYFERFANTFSRIMDKLSRI